MALYTDTLAERVRFTPAIAVTQARPVTAMDSVRLFPNLIVSYGLIVAEHLRLRETLEPQQIGNATVTDAVLLAAHLASAREIALADGVGIAFAQELRDAIVLLERLRLSDALQVNALYSLTVHQSMRLTASLLRWFGADIEDGLQLDDDALARVLAFAGVDEGIGVEAAVTPQLLVRATARDGIAIDSEQLVRMLFQPTMFEGVEFEAGYIGPDGSFTAWAMNTRTGAVTEYSDFTFNSFGRVGNRYIGASADGLYELVGDDDDGEEIIARIKSGYMQFGGTHLSRLKAAYIAATGEGEMLLKIVEKGGKTYVYRTDTRDGRSTKVHMGKGQKARYFAFELVTSAQDFDLDTIEFVPIVVPRRV